MELSTTPLTRRHVLVGGAAAGAVWATPSIIGSATVAAAVGSCVETTVNWTSITSAGSVYTASGSTGTLTITATITANLSGGATPIVFIAGGSQISVGMWGQSVGDFYTVAFSFGDSAGTVCSAATSIIDIDQTGSGIGCGGFSRFRDEISAITGTTLTTTPINNVVEGPAGTWSSSAICATTDTDNLGLSWTNNPGVTGTGFTYTAATPPGTNPIPNYQLIKIDPVALCSTGGAGPGAPVPGGAQVEPTPLGLIEAPQHDAP